MKKVIAWLLVLALTAAVSIGATLAYLTDTDEDVNVMTVGKVKIDQLEYERIDDETKDEDATVQEFHDNKPLYPGVYEDDFDFGTDDNYVNWDQIGKEDYTSGIWNPDEINNEVDKMVFVKNKGDYDAYVRSVFAFEAGNYTTLEEFRNMVHLNLNDTDWTWEWVQTPVTIGESTYFVATATYNEVLAPGALTEISLSQIALDKTATNEDVEAFGETYQVLVKSQGIQADGFTDPDTALNEGFGEVTADNVPWENDSPIKGIDLRTALHYLNGDTTGTKITTAVNKVVYALNSEYPDIVSNEKGTLVDVEQDVNVHAYYMEEDGAYTVYFLANDTIYSPKDSSSLYDAMGALVEVDTHNYDVSRVKTMLNMFRNCKKLATMDTGDWDTSNVTTMYQTFRNCQSLNGLDVSNWDVSKVTSMYAMFAYNYAMTELDVSKWDVANVKNMAAMFAYNYYLQYLDVSNWDTGSVTSFVAMFQGNHNKGNMQIKNLDVSNWDTSSCTAMNHMFYSCGQLTDLDMSNWDVSNVTTFTHMFADCFKLESVDFTGWDTSSAEDFSAMFNNCGSLKTVDISDFDTQNTTTFSQMFEYCSNLEEIKGLDKLDTSKLEICYEMFSGAGKLTVLDLSSFHTPNLWVTERMFMNCSGLETIYVSDGWNVEKVTNDKNTFLNCSSLVGGNGTEFDSSMIDKTYACVDTDETPGYLTYKAAE